MKIVDVALKDLRRVFRSPFDLVMMFGAPLLLAGLLYFAFGGMSSGSGSYNLARTKVVVANLDKAGAGSSFQAGAMLVSFLQGKDLVNMVEISQASDEAAARAAVDQRRAGVALIIPGNFTQFP